MIKAQKKNQINRSLIRRLILGGKEDNRISRQELIRLAKLNPRTVDSYTDELEKLGIITCQNVVNGQGRPEKYYLSTNEGIMFLGVYQWKTMLYFMISDVGINPMYLERFELDMGNDVSGQLEAICEAVKKALDSNKTYRLAGLGMVFHPYETTVQEKIFFQSLARRLEQQYQVPIRKLDACNAMLLSVFRSHSMLHAEYNGRALNLGLINPSDRIYLGLMLNGMPQEYRERINSVDKQLLEGIFTHREIAAQFDGSSIKTAYDYRLAVYTDDKAAQEVSVLEAVKLSAGIKRLKQHYSLDKIFLINVTPNTMKNLLKLTAEDPELSGFPIESLKEFSPTDYLKSSCDLAVQMIYGNFLYKFLTD